MYVFKLIGLMFVNLLKDAWGVPKALASAAKEKRLQTERDRSEAERLDRIRNPWKFLGKS